ncbi:uncharacterized protein FIESC28_02628 [Fusarium coffeatum]|uniref:Ankyrin repeat protein n=1 Tax=Fusarium coffeatum TaxID=231269 RepID=A0A366S6Q3_9HYPO|nr:uncharacterized protein FIESC28_02628 [Fusarium coffeatum]RBR24578.1 hypothetical protein FIESC28_02628 [Fusarium coffeatum]
MANLPKLPSPHSQLPKYISDHKEKPITEILDPYRKYEAELRSVYAQDRQNPILDDPYLNVVPLFTEDTKFITTRARDLETESEEEKSKYIMALPDDKRRPHDSPATVANLVEFQKNFNIFSESSLSDLDWSNVVAAGSSVVNCLLPVPKGFDTTKRKLREYYHEKFCPASDVDLFLYGLNHDQAIEKIKQIERAVKDALLNEVTVTHPVSEILTGFDIDAAGAAYDGTQVFVTPRALGSFITQINHIDLTRRSPSYENRLSKYAKRNFEIYYGDFQKQKVDPTIYERSFRRTLGLARLLVLERLPTTTARETYLDKRREERGRPRVYRTRQVLHGNIKDYHEDEVADWLSDEDVSNYHTFTVPYGQHFNAKRIEKLCYTRDLLLNAEWNQPDEREVYLHRHPAFFGRVQDVIEDCCGCCPEPVTDEEKEIAEKEAEIYIKGKVSFLIDDPGRQQIGSFNPLTENDWTDMAYVGNVTRLCQSIVDGDAEDVSNWLSQEGSDPNKRDYTGRSPLHLAVMTSTPEVVKCLVDHGARLTARLADGRNALHLAASRGDSSIIKILMEKSIENEEAEEERQDKKRKAAKKAGSAAGDGDSEGDEESDGEIVDGEATDVDSASMTTGSFVKVKQDEGDSADADDLVPEESQDEPDFFNIDALAWDLQCSPLHLAIAEGNEDAVKTLCDYGSDSIMPVKSLRDSDARAILTLVLALSLPNDKAKSMADLLLKLGATSAQADARGCSAFHRYVEAGEEELIDTLLDTDKTGIKVAINHMVCGGSYWNSECTAPINTAIENGNVALVLKLLTTGAKADIDFDTWLKSAKVSSLSSNLGDLEKNQKMYKESVEQPLITAIRSGNTDIAIKLLENGADPNSLDTKTQQLIFNEYQRSWNKGQSALDMVRSSLKGLRGYTYEKTTPVKPRETPGLDEFLQGLTEGTYAHTIVSSDVESHKYNYIHAKERYEKDIKKMKEPKGVPEKNETIKELLAGFEVVENTLLSKGAKPFAELYPDIKTYGGDDRSSRNSRKSEDEAPKPYEFRFSFNNDRDMTEKRRDGYIELMEAAWAGDVEKVKKLSLQAWGPEQDQAPLKIAVSDNYGNTPFSIAVLRGHHELAKALLEIVKAQWSPPKKDKVRFRMDTGGDEDEEYSEDSDESDDSQDGEPRIVSEKVQQQFTIDDIGHVDLNVESHTKPLEVICQSVPTQWSIPNEKRFYHWINESLFNHMLAIDDTNGLKFLLDMAQQYSSQKFEGDNEGEDEDSSTGFVFPRSGFSYCVESGKTKLLALIIKRTGAGIPLNHLVKKSGVELKRKPRFYQGLTVYGRKRKDWATAGRGMVVRSSGPMTPPLLDAALAGNLDSVEFFLGDTPHRLYSEFSKSKASRDDIRFKHLKESPGGFDRAISKWLGADNDLVIHCAVLAHPGESANEVLEFLVETFPAAVEKKNTEGDTPLMVACRLGRIDAVKILLSANADQSTRNQKGENILHAALACLPKDHQLRELLDLLDPDLRSHLFLQKKNLSENGTTPFHTWVSQASGVQPDNINYYHRRYKPYDGKEKEMIQMLNLLLEYSKGDELEMLNGAGDTCLHTAIMMNMIALVQALIRYRPSLVYRENAVGRTPAELAHDRLTSQKFEMLNNVERGRNDTVGDTLRRRPEEFASKTDIQTQAPGQRKEFLETLGLSDTYKTEDVSLIQAEMGVKKQHSNQSLDIKTIRRVLWDFCHTAMQKYPGNRRLVTLNEANDVAKRLGEKYSASRYFSVQARVEDGEDDSEEKENNTTVDYAVKVMNSRLSRAWHIEEEEKEEEEVAESSASSSSESYAS